MEKDNSWKCLDARKLTENEQKGLCKMMHSAFLEIRHLGWQGKAQQSADLADAFHNLPLFLDRDDFSFEFFAYFLKVYYKKYPDPNIFNYLSMLENVMNNKP
ncbi:MAG: hypothetical protein HY819_21985 [Acidobacteria bacterium]|nr:hypothetical protein [Acidobacteriota bacterium]